MKKYTVTLNTPFNDAVAATLKKHGVSCRFSTDLNPLLLFVAAPDRAALENLDCVVDVRESRTFELYV